jgi:hypothetical protein
MGSILRDSKRRQLVVMVCPRGYQVTGDGRVHQVKWEGVAGGGGVSSGIGRDGDSGVHEQRRLGSRQRCLSLGVMRTGDGDGVPTVTP